MSGDNMHGTQPDIRYSTKVQHHEEWKLEDLLKEIPNWEQDYKQLMKKEACLLTKQQVELLDGRSIMSHEGMLYGKMYADWKVRRGFDF